MIKRACQWFSVLEEEGELKKKGSLEQKREKEEVELTWTWIIGLWLRPCPGLVGLNKMGAEPSGCGRCTRFLTDREQRKVNKRIQHRWRFQSIGYSLSLKGLGCGHPLCARLPCFAYHACGRCCQGEFNLIVFFLLLPKCLIPLCEIDSLGEHRQRRVWKPNLSKCCHCCRPSR